MTGSTRIRDAAPADARAIASVHIDTWRSTYRGHFPDALLDGLDLERWAAQRERRLREAAADEVNLVAERDGEVIGFAMAGPARATDPGMGEVYAIYVRDGAQRSGAGTALLAEAARRLDALGLRGLLIWVLRENAKGRAFYERMGGRAEREKVESLGAPAGPRHEIIETGYVWGDTGPLRSRSAGGSSGSDQRM